MVYNRHKERLHKADEFDDKSHGVINETDD